MRLLPDSIAGRILTLLFTSLVVFHIGSIFLYQFGLEAELDVSNEQHLADRLTSIKRAIAREAPTKREELAHTLSGGPLEIHWSEALLAPRPGSSPIDFSSLRHKLLAADPELQEEAISVGAAAALPEHASATRFRIVSLRLDDGSWVNVTATKNIEPHTGIRQITLSTTLMVLGVIVVAAILIHPLTRSLRSLADAANRLDLDAAPAPVAEAGPSEVRALSTAFNNMQKRVKRLVDDRTQTLAAISHDLKTPLTRLRLRAEDIGDPELVNAVSGDLAEMEAMLDSTLAFLRGDQVGEEKKPIDLGSLLETICSDLADLGHNTTLTRNGPAVVCGRHLALKRAMSNLIENAVRHGGRARVTLRNLGNDTEILIDDDGPGIAEAEQEAVFRPFYRVDESRNRETGGVGLGLTVARSIVQSHTGELELINRSEGGLRVRIKLPKQT